MKISKVNDYGSWIKKEALAQPFSEEQQKELAEKGVFSIPDVADKYPKGGKGGTKAGRGYKDILQETGMIDVFQTDDPRLRKFFIPQAKNIVLLNGKEYFLANVVKSKDNKKTKEHTDGEIIVFGPVVRGENGAIDWEQMKGSPEKFSYDELGEQIERSPHVIKERLNDINSETERYNKFVERIMKEEESGKMGTVTILPLQIGYAEEALKERLAKLEGQKKSMESGESRKEEQNQAIQQTYQQMNQEVAGGKEISPQDYAVLLLEQKFHGTSSLEDLRGTIGAESMPFDEQTNAQLKDFILKIVDWQIQERQKDNQAKEQRGEQRAERMEEEDLPEMKQMVLEKIAPITQLPGKHQKAPGYYSPEGFGQSDNQAGGTIDQDYSELNAILASLERAKGEIVSLPSKSAEYLQGEGGMAIQKIEEFMKNVDAFIKRYQENPFIETPEGLSVNPKLFGNQGQLGNGLLSIVLRQVLMSTRSEIDRIKAGQPPASEKIEQQKERVAPKQEEPAQEATPAPEVKAKAKTDIQKMSETLWKAFENRGRLR